MTIAYMFWFGLVCGILVGVVAIGFAAWAFHRQTTKRTAEIAQAFTAPTATTKGRGN